MPKFEVGDLVKICTKDKKLRQPNTDLPEEYMEEDGKVAEIATVTKTNYEIFRLNPDCDSYEYQLNYVHATYSFLSDELELVQKGISETDFEDIDEII